MFKIIGADGQEYGPVTADELRAWIAEGRANAQTRVQADGAAEWKSLGDFAEFAAALAAKAQLSGPPPIARRASEGAAVPSKRTNAMALTGMILGIASVTFGLFCCCGPLFALLGLVFSCIGLSQVSRDPLRQAGKGMAVAGIVTSVFGLVGYIIIATIFGFAGAIGRALHGRPF